jgi:serine/threonine-protein kinase
MLELTAEEFGQRAYNLNLITERDLQKVWAHFGTRDVPLGALTTHMERQGLVTNYQVERLLKGEKAGFFYGDYKVLYFVGKGTFARVYRAAHKETGQVVALKVLRKQYSENPVDVQKFLREGEMGVKLRHPNIVPCFEVHSLRRSHFLVMAFVEGQSLREFVNIRKQVDALESCQIISSVVAGLVYGSEKGVTHRDLKLSNILISSDGVPQIVDFGLAGVSTENGKGDFTNTRTIDYATLEKLSGVSKDDARSDIFFCGCMLYHMLCGKPPISETRDRAERQNPKRFKEIIPIRKHLPDIPYVVERVVNKSMEIDADKRYGKPVEMLVDLRKAIKSLEAGDVSTEAAPALEGEGKTVLIVESNTKVQDALRESLKKQGYRVLVMSDPSRAEQRISADAGVADVFLISTAALGQEALELFQRLSASDATKATPIVLLLGKNQTKFLDRIPFADHQRAVAMPLKMVILRKALIEAMQPASVE